jgi:DNA-binding transcriptional LysR family regulator
MHASGLDVLIRAGDPPESGLVARKLMEFRFGVYAAPAYLERAGEPATPDELLQHHCLVHTPPGAMKPWDEWQFERNGKSKLVKVPSVLVTDDREGLIAAALAGCGLMRIGMFDPSLISSGQLRKVLNDWTCPNVHAHSIYAMYRKTPRPVPKVSAFLEFAAAAFAAFDTDELTLIHATSLHRAKSALRRDDASPLQL